MQTTKANELYAGADLHGNNVFLSVCDADGNVQFKRRVKPNLDAVNAALDPYWPQIKAMGVESTFNWYWLVDGLREQDHDVRLGNQRNGGVFCVEPLRCFLRKLCLRRTGTSNG